MQLIIGLMTLSMAIAVFVPPNTTIGIAAPLLVVLARLLQGFATGGEFASATSFLVEIAPPERRGLYGSLQMVGQSLAALAGAGAGALVVHDLAPAQLDSWGWRLPFALRLVIAPVGLYIRKYLEETEPFLKSRCIRSGSEMASSLVTNHRRGLSVTFGFVICGTMSYYVVLVYMPTFANTQLGIPLSQALVAQVIGLTWLTIIIPLFGALSDRIGRRPVLLAATVAYLVLLYPSFEWVSATPGLLRLTIMQSALCSVVGMYFGPLSTALAEQFPTRVRSTGLAVSYNSAVMLFGGFAQFIVTWLIRETGSQLAPADYVMFGAVVGLVVSVFLTERHSENFAASEVHLLPVSSGINAG